MESSTPGNWPSGMRRAFASIATAVLFGLAGCGGGSGSGSSSPASGSTTSAVEAAEDRVTEEEFRSDIERACEQLARDAQIAEDPVLLIHDFLGALEQVEVPRDDDGTARRFMAALTGAYTKAAANPEIIADPRAIPPELVQADVLAQELLLGLPGCGVGVRRPE